MFSIPIFIEREVEDLWCAIRDVSDKTPGAQVYDACTKMHDLAVYLSDFGDELDGDELPGIESITDAMNFPEVVAAAGKLVEKVKSHHAKKTGK